jgi:two-component system, OmpR family, KDP operon response regulator KdpE
VTGNAEPRAEGQLRVLVVEDILPIRRLLQVTLESNGYDVVTAVDLKSALEALARLPPDVILTDWTLPDGHPNALIRAARAAHPKTRVIVCSGTADAPEIAVDAFLAKPFSLEDLLRVVRAVT